MGGLIDVKTSLLWWRSLLFIQPTYWHSFTDTPLKRELNQDMPRPDFCIGTDKFHTPKELENRANSYLQQQGYSVGINEPYQGTLIPMPYFHKEKRVEGIMIEVGRKLYMQMKGNQPVKSAGFAWIRQVVAGLLAELEGE